jgi:DNA-directed RNA polymerase subunit RPC12/RpoP
LNNSDEEYSCEKCSKTFASEKFLQIHSEATHKEKCTECDFETRHKEIMKEFGK